jgi:hypothetical protein
MVDHNVVAPMLTINGSFATAETSSDFGGSWRVVAIYYTNALDDGEEDVAIASRGGD